MLGQHAPADYRRTHWLRELTILNNGRSWEEGQKTQLAAAKKAAVEWSLVALE